MALASDAKLPEDVIDAAIAWAVKIEYANPGATTRQGFESWLQADPRHQLAWQRMQALGKGTRLSGMPISGALAHEILDKAQRQREKRLKHTQTRRNITKLLALVGVGALTGFGVREYTPWQRVIADASTATGAQKTLQLPDGTSMLLNTDSAIGYEFDGRQRRITLYRGEIFIATGADSGYNQRRPFWVQTPYGSMQALGTRFIVRLNPAEQRARISVTEGAVQLHPGHNHTASPIVEAGQSRWLSKTGTADADVQGMEPAAWVDGVIAGQNMRLADFLAELNRYRPGRIVWDDSVADLPVSGVFHTRDTDQALKLLLQTHPIHITWRSRYWVRVKAP